LDNGSVVRPTLTGIAAYQKCQEAARSFKGKYLSSGTNRSEFNGELTPLQEACKIIVTNEAILDAQREAKKKLSEAETSKMASLELDLGLQGNEEQAQLFRAGAT